MVATNVDGLRSMLQAAHDARAGRFVFLSSMVVYGGADQVDLDESAPFVETGDNYNYTKIACERELQAFVRRTGIEAVILRPPYVYGPRDRQFLPRVLTSLRDGDWVYLSGGVRPFTLAYVGSVVEACVLAAASADAAGEAFIIADGESITRKELVELICEEMGYAVPTKSVPRRVAKMLCPVYECVAKLLRKQDPPRLNRFRLKFAGATLTFDISKARRVLGYEPKRPVREALTDTLSWFRENRTEFLPGE
jgi:nucleoside-diphosphate-sugar epimerase